MNARKKLLPVLIVPVLLLAACSGGPLSLNAPAVAVPDVAAAQLPAPAASDSAQGLAALETTFEQVYAEVNPSVVNIQVIINGSAGLGSQGSSEGLGSGFVWDSQGHIVTNAHVVDGADQISVTFSDGVIADAKLVGEDKYSDLAVIQVDAKAAELKPVKLADSNEVKVGQLAIAIGNPFGLQGTMTQGIISGLSRSLPVDSTSSALGQQGGTYSIPDIIQTDASINPGNSGGVLVNDQGQVVGVTAAIASATRSNSGVGFVIPSDIVQKVVPSLIQNGKAEHAYMGITGTTVTPAIAAAANLPENQRGAIVIDLTPGGPAAKAGLKAGNRQVAIDGQQVAIDGDVIIAIDGQTVTRFEDMVSYLYNNTDPGQTITLTILRQGKQQTVDLKLGTLPG